MVTIIPLTATSNIAQAPVSFDTGIPASVTHQAHSSL